MIKVSNINKYFNKKKNNEIHVLNNIDLELPDTGLITILGQSGSGKTTLLNVLGGLDKFTGQIVYDNKIINNYKMHEIDALRKEQIGYVFQNYNLLTDISVYDNLRVALEVIDITNQEEVDKRIEYALKAVGLYKFRKKLASALSGGQMQRVSIARALVKHSKIIIADEPTGNLDSDNSIEVMNILKKISKYSLVLLVTHDQQLAEFYSDRIIEIKDGQIINNRESNQGPLLTQTRNTIYLKDLQKVNGESGKIKYTLYLEDDIDDLEFTIVQHNNQFYLKSNQKVKMLSDTPLKLVDDHYKEKKINEIEDYNYDTSWFKDQKNSNWIKKVFENIKTSLISFFQTRKKEKFFHAIFFLIGIVLAFVNISYVNYIAVDDSSFFYDNEVYGVKEKENIDYDATFDCIAYDFAIKRAVENGYIDNFYQTRYYHSLDFTFTINSFNIKRINVNTSIWDQELVKNDSLICGRMANNDSEIVIGKNTADIMLKAIGEKKVKYEHLLNINVGEIDKKNIVGIVDRESQAAYTVLNYDGLLVSYGMGVTQIGPIVERGYYLYEKDNYEIVFGSDLNENDNDGYLFNINCIDIEDKGLDYPALFEKYKTKTFTSIGGQEKTFNLKGLCRKKENSYLSSEFIVNDKEFISLEDSNLYTFDNGNVDYKIVEGTDITKPFECLVSAYSKCKVGDKLGENEDLVVVGKYLLNQETYPFIYGLSSSVLSSKITNSYVHYSENKNVSNFGNNFYFSTKNYSALEKLFTSYGFTIMNSYDVQYYINFQYIAQTKQMLIPMMIVLIAVTIIYIYFTMRSKMIHDIYSIGVYRSLGLSRWKMIVKYMIEIIVITTFTSFIGYLFVSLFYEYIASKFALLGSGMPLLFSYGSTYLILVGLFLANILIGLIPVFNLMRKTPSEIISKYDI